MKQWSINWKSSTSVRKQRKYRFNAPLHIKRKLTSSHLTKELRLKYSRRSVPIVKGDKVKVVVGQFSGHVGKVDRVDVKRTRIYISGIEISKKDGSKTTYPINPSNVIITELNLEDKKRAMMLEKKKVIKK